MHDPCESCRHFTAAYTSDRRYGLCLWKPTEAVPTCWETGAKSVMRTDGVSCPVWARQGAEELVGAKL